MLQVKPSADKLVSDKLAAHRIVTTSHDHRLLFQSYSSQQPHCFGFLNDQSCSQVE